MENHSFGLIFKSQIRKTSNWIIQNPHPPLPHHYEQVISSYLKVRWPLLHQFGFYQGKASAVFCTLATMNKRLQNGLCNRMISKGQRVLKMHSSHISDLTRLFLWSKLLAKNTNFKEWEFSADVRELFSRLYMVSNMREVKSNFNPLFTPWCPVWVVFRVSPTPPFLFMSAMPD